MTLPPERINVKRRRDDDPLETLYIQSKKYRPSALWTLQSSSETPQLASKSAEPFPKKSTSLSTAIPGAHASIQPTVSSATDTLPERSHDTLQSQTLEERSAEHHDVINALPRLQVASVSKVSERHGIIHKTEPRLRRFHLDSDTFPRLKRQLSSTGGIRKSRKPQRDTLALFVETKIGERVIEQSIRARRPQHADAVKGQDNHVQDGPEPVVSPIRKRPTTGAAEMAWRVETWARQKDGARNEERQTTNRNPTNWDHASILLAEELRQFAMEESETQEQRPQISSAQQLKFKPKPPKPREPKVEEDPATIQPDPAIHGGSDEIDDYIIDTYIRASLPPPKVDESLQSYLDPLQVLDGSKVGILIIENEQEDLWESFAHEQMSDEEIESDEEDENAEDFYGNDYPEDELDIEDEFDRGSYNFRINASDNDECNSEELEWSDSENHLE